MTEPIEVCTRLVVPVAKLNDLEELTRLYDEGLRRWHGTSLRRVGDVWVDYSEPGPHPDLVTVMVQADVVRQEKEDS